MISQRLGYAGDRAIFEALMQQKMTIDKMRSLFLKKGILVSPSDDREFLARYYSSLPISYTDHKEIEEKMAVRKRTEKVSSVELVPVDEYKIPLDLITESIECIKSDFEKQGYKISHSEDNNRTQILQIEHNKIDYSRSDLLQNRLETSEICIEPIGNGNYIIRSTNTESTLAIRNEIVKNIKNKSKGNDNTFLVNVESISLRHISDNKKRSEFLITLMNKTMSDYELHDVLQAGIHKCYSDTVEDDTSTSISEEELAAKLKAVVFKGSGVHKANEITTLSNEGFYYVKATFILTHKRDRNRYEIEVEFKEPDNCDNFSYILKGIYYFQNSSSGISYSARRNAPTSELSGILRDIEKGAKLALNQINI